MTTTSVQLWERIHAAGLASPEDCRRWAAEVSNSATQDCLHDPNKLAAELIRLGKITSFQANVLFNNLPIPLAVGPYRIIESLESRLGANWFQAIDAGNSKVSRLLCFLLTPQSLARQNVQSWPPSIAMAESHVALSHPCLDRWLSAGIDKSNVIGFCYELQGQSLTELLANQPLSWPSSVAMIEQLASAIQKLHEAGLVHGCICPDAIWCADENEFVLRRDTMYPPSNPFSSNGNSILARTHDSLLAIAAPELTLPTSSPSIHTDLYALGCVWYQSLTGKSPWTSKTNWNSQDWANAHLGKAPQTLDAQQLPAPLQRCLAHLIAKNPSARFQSAAALIKAIESAATEAHEQTESLQSNAPAILTTSVKEAPRAYAIDKPAVDATEKPKPAVQPKPVVPPKPLAPAASIKEIQSATPAPAKSTTQEVQQLSSPPASKQVHKPERTTEQSDAPELGQSLAGQSPAGIKKDTSKDSATVKAASKDDLAQPIAPVPKPQPQKVHQNTSTDSAPKKKKKSKKKKKPVWILPAMIGGACLFFGIVISLLMRSGSKTMTVEPHANIAITVSPSGTPSGDKKIIEDPIANVPRADAPNAKPANVVTEFFAVEPDDGQMLWAPPNAGSAYSLELFPAGVEAVVFLSGNAFLGRGAASGLGTWWSQMQPELIKQFAKTPLLNDSRIASVAIALYTSKNPGLPQAVFRISYAQPVKVESIAQEAPAYKLKLFDPKSSNKKGFWSNELQPNSTSIVMDDLQTDVTAMIRRAVIGPSELLSSLPELNGGPAPLRRQLESLLKSTDSRSDVSVIAAPSFLFGDGRELLSSAPKLQDALRDAIDESIQAIAFSTTIEPRWYLELRMVSSETKDLGKYASALKSRLTGLPDSFEKGLSAGLELHPYWRALGLRYPQMMRALNKYLRVGLEDGQVVANVYLPSDAANNIAIASWMALHPTTSAAPSNVASKPQTTSKPVGKSIEEILDSKISIGFDQESLEAALQLIASEVAESVLAGAAMSMSIDGASFQKEGITRNQSIRDFRQSAVPLRAVLTDLVRRANPVTTVQSPTEKNQKVVWLIADDPDRQGSKKIELTTRTNAESKKLELPKEFVP